MYLHCEVDIAIASIRYGEFVLFRVFQRDRYFSNVKFAVSAFMSILYYG